MCGPPDLKHRSDAQATGRMSDGVVQRPRSDPWTHGSDMPDILAQVTQVSSVATPRVVSDLLLGVGANTHPLCTSWQGCAHMLAHVPTCTGR